MKLLSYGAILWDIIEGDEHIGGAPFNLAAHAAKLGAETHFMSAVGRDELGRRAREWIRRCGIYDKLVKDTDQPTGVVDVKLDADGVPDFTIREPAAWDYITVTDEEVDWIKEQHFDCFCFGSLEQRQPVTKATLRRVLEACRFEWVLCDINLRMDYYDRERVEYCVKECNILKLNDEEAVKVAQMLDLGLSEEAACRRLREQYHVEIVCVTCGAEGCRLHTSEGVTDCPGRQVKVADTVGAGDAFTAAFLVKICEGASSQEAGDFACRLGALVASKRGAIPEYDARTMNDER